MCFYFCLFNIFRFVFFYCDLHYDTLSKYQRTQVGYRKDKKKYQNVCIFILNSKAIFSSYELLDWINPGIVVPLVSSYNKAVTFLFSQSVHEMPFPLNDFSLCFLAYWLDWHWWNEWNSILHDNSILEQCRTWLQSCFHLI